MKLTELSCARGAPMGRREHRAGAGGEPLHFELEWVPFTDGCYDAGGAYWGGPDNLYCAIGRFDGGDEAEIYLRAASRKRAMAVVLEDYPGSTFEPENGSLIRQMIEKLEEFRDTLTEPADDDEYVFVSDEINDLESMLEDLK